MGNNDTTAARDFHLSTKLRYIDLKSKPALYKAYPGLPRIPLPDAPSLDSPTLACIVGPTPASDSGFGLPELAQLLHYSAGLIRRSEIPSAGEVHYRAAASAGALYPVELYVVCGGLPGLSAGVYHYAPAENALVMLREGDFRRHLAQAAADEGLAQCGAAIVCSTVFWRSAWKYRTRGYRYCFWDNGTVLSNLLAAANGMGRPARIIAGFVDSELDRLLGLDGEREASACLVAVAQGSPPSEDPPDEIEAVAPGLLGDEHLLNYPESELLHAASRLQHAGEVREWRGAPPSGGRPVAAAAPAHAPAIESAFLGQVITKRGSTRRFARETFPAEQFAALLQASTARAPTDYAPSEAGGLIDTYLIVNAIEGITPGSYFYAPGEAGGPGQLELLSEGEYREEAGHLCFEQALAADASAVAFFMTDLEAVLERYGNRGYRTAQLEAGVLGGRMYLASHSLGLGATGMTFFDDAVAAFFSPHAVGKSLMFLVGLGVTGKPNQVRPFRSRTAMLKDSLARGAAGGKRPVPDWLYS